MYFGWSAVTQLVPFFFLDLTCTTATTAPITVIGKNIHSVVYTINYIEQSCL